MQTVNVEILVPKETKEVIDAVVGLIADIKAKKSLTVIASENLPALMVAVDGVTQIGEELSSEHKADLAAYLVKELSKALGL